jgi:hypothetical protein
MRPTAAVAVNKLVCKMTSRAIRPAGLIQIQAGTEAAFLAHQDIGLIAGDGSAGPAAGHGAGDRYHLAVICGNLRLTFIKI